MFKIQTEQIGSTWFARIQVHLFEEDPTTATHQWGVRGQGDTPEAAIEDAIKRTSASLYQTTSRLRASRPATA